jgi:hypothetical protein
VLVEHDIGFLPAIDPEQLDLSGHREAEEQDRSRI